jgi:hypothetical protein
VTKEELTQAERDEIEDDPEAGEGEDNDSAQIEPGDATEVDPGSDTDLEEGSSDSSIEDIGEQSKR